MSGLFVIVVLFFLLGIFHEFLDGQYDKDEVITLDELCEIGQLSKRSYRCLREQGRTPVAYRMGRRLYFKRGDVQAWMTTVRMVRIDPPRPTVWRR
ncbi:MAG: helix-turn-helix domain-containing protein [Actinobacteria bacterium]|nr:helix-turn-helix domain-containing protein [Actinomycetota bacterium]